MLTQSEWPAAVDALRIVAKLVGNVADCGDSVAKFRTAKLCNPAIASRCYNVAGAPALLRLAGFEAHGDVLKFEARDGLGVASALVGRCEPCLLILTLRARTGRIPNVFFCSLDNT